MNIKKAEEFKHDLIDLLFKYDLSLSRFVEMMHNDDIIKYLGGLEKLQENFYLYCKKIGFII